MCVEIPTDSTIQADRVKYSILLEADDRSKKPVSPWPAILTKACRCATRPVANLLIVATGLGFATQRAPRNTFIFG